jgi:hypothetical protein
MRRCLFAFAGMAMLASRVLAADVPGVQLALGYGYLHDSDLVFESLSLGWYASVCGSVTDNVGIVLDVGGNYHSTEGPSVDVHSFLAGPRLAIYGSGKVVPYVQLLAGVTRRHTSHHPDHETSSDLSFQPGLGLSVPVSTRVAFGLGADYRAILAEGATSNEVRITAAVVFRWGSR